MVAGFVGFTVFYSCVLRCPLRNFSHLCSGFQGHVVTLGWLCCCPCVSGSWGALHELFLLLPFAPLACEGYVCILILRGIGGVVGPVGCGMWSVCPPPGLT